MMKQCHRRGEIFIKTILVSACPMIWQQQMLTNHKYFKWHMLDVYIAHGNMYVSNMQITVLFSALHKL